MGVICDKMYDIDTFFALEEYLSSEEVHAVKKLL